MEQRPITERYWSRFKRSDGAWSGGDFEELVGCLLKVSIGGVWRKTPGSWDGSRDFALVSRDKRAWNAKCGIRRSVSVR